MTKLSWDAIGARTYETGIDQGVLYIPDGSGAYTSGFAWNGLTKVTEKPTGATATALYADNIKYLNLISAEQFEADISSYTYPDEFAQCDGTYQPEPGVSIGQQTRKPFGLCYRTKVGTDLNPDAGVKIHLVYGATAAPSQKDYATVNDNPAAIEFSWSVTTIPVPVTGHKPVATLTIDSTKVDSTAFSELEDALYGTSGSDPRLPTPDEVLAFFSGTVTAVTPTAPTYNGSTHVVTIPTVTGVNYYDISGALVTGTITIAASTIYTARPAAGYRFTTPSVDEWLITY